jgi:flagellar hook-associated protein 1 FlgK
MSIPTLTGIQTAFSGLEAEQAALDTTGNNIDNASTPGYTEEVVNLDTTTPQEIPAESFNDGVTQTQLGTGVDVGSITRQRNTYLDASYRAQNTILGFDSQNASQLGSAQALFQENGSSTSGLSSMMSTFWSDWNSVADNTSSSAAKQSLVDDATTMTQGFNSLYTQLSDVQSQASQQFSSLTAGNGELSQDANTIAQLNGQISQEIADGQSPNELEDARDSAIDDLSSLGNVTVSQQSDGTVTIGFGDAAQPLVQGTTVNWPQTITAATGGELGALLDTASSTGSVGQMMSSLNTVAGDLISSVNGLSTTTPFFSGSNASTIAVAATPSTVQTSSTSTPSGNDVALAIAALQGGSADQAYQALVAQVGGAVQSAQNSQTTQQAVVNAFQSQRESADGVSLDQEMTNLVTFQRGYQASAQALNTITQVLGTLISQVGGAGM